MSTFAAVNLPDPASYDVEDLGSLAGHTEARGINARGQVAGFSFNGATCCAQAFIFTPPGPAHYLPYSSYGITYGQGINAAGVLVGDKDVSGGGGGYEAFRYSGTLHTLGRLSDEFPYSQGVGINNRNEVVGDAYNGTTQRAFLYDVQSRWLNLGTLKNGRSSFARGINDHTEVVGYSEVLAFSPSYWRPGHAFYWDRNLGMTDINDIILHPSIRAPWTSRQEFHARRTSLAGGTHERHRRNASEKHPQGRSERRDDRLGCRAGALQCRSRSQRLG